MFPAANFHVGIDEIVQRVPLLLRIELQVAADGELNPVRVVRAEEIVLPLRVLPGFRDVYRNPAGLGSKKLRPTVITRNVRSSFVTRQGKADFKSCRNAL